MTTDFKGKFLDISDLIQTEFDRNVSIYGDKIKCGRGCSECCSQIFRITALDSFMITEHVKTLPVERQHELKIKAKEYVSELERPEFVNIPEAAVNIGTQSNTKDELRIPCPALGSEGECTIYEARPVVCRRFGMPIYDYKNPGKVHACHLNFRKDEEILDDELIPNQTAIGIKWDALKDEFLAETNSEEGKFTTIAHSILGL